MGEMNGVMEDWVYAGSWEGRNSLSKCEKAGQNPKLPSSETEHDYQSLRSLAFLVDTSEFKNPTAVYWGTPEGLEGSQDRYAYGYIPINVQLALAMIDMVEPYVKLNSLDYSEEKNTLTIQWQGGGCKTVDKTFLKWTNKRSHESAVSNEKKGPGYYGDGNFTFQEVIKLNDTEFNIDVAIAMTCDQNWSEEVDTKLKLSPQSHIAQARTNKTYYAESNGYKITSKQVVDYKMKDITIDYLVKNRISDIGDLNLVVEFTECGGFANAGNVLMQIIEEDGSSSLQFNGKLSIDDPFLEGHLYQYGDIGGCTQSIGLKLNTSTFEPDIGNGLIEMSPKILH